MSKAPGFLSVDNVLYLHNSTIETEGGAQCVRDLPLLESAVLMPQQQFAGQYLHPDIAAMAAAHLYHIICNHPFVDGNKRTGLIAAFVFLDANGHELTATAEDVEQTARQVASGELAKDGLNAWFQNHMRSRE